MSGDIPLLSPDEILKFYLAGITNQQLQPEELNYALRATPTSTTGGEPLDTTKQGNFTREKKS